MKKEKTRNRNLERILVLTSVGLIFLSIIGFSIVKYTKLDTIDTGSVVNEDYEEDLDWLSDNCDCIERERFKCSNGFEVDEERRLCFKGNEITNVLLGCSMYNCSGEIKKVK